ncbi:COG4705 family protein [Microbacterium sp. P5_E9]
MTKPMPEHIRTILFNRVPEVTFAFWVIKILSTTTGETFADYLNDGLGLGLTITTWVMSALLAISLVAQFMTKRYNSGIYWSVVVLISIVGTLLTDNLTDVLGVELWVSTVIFSVVLAATFGIWFARERTLSIHTIFTRRREAFYWVAILFTFALGTAAGDLISEGMGLGYLFGTILFASLIGIIVIARFAFKANVVFCFWAAYVLTRPLGASIGDLLSQDPADGGLGLGTTVTSFVFLAVIVALAAYLGIKVRHQRAAAVEEYKASLLLEGDAVDVPA